MLIVAHAEKEAALRTDLFTMTYAFILDKNAAASSEATLDKKKVVVSEQTEMSLTTIEDFHWCLLEAQNGLEYITAESTADWNLNFDRIIPFS